LRFGRISKRHEEANERQMLKAIDLATALVQRGPARRTRRAPTNSTS
jgi:hypothetical protein